MPETNNANCIGMATEQPMRSEAAKCIRIVEVLLLRTLRFRSRYRISEFANIPNTKAMVRVIPFPAREVVVG
jgi:hypothetical protein